MADLVIRGGRLLGPDTDVVADVAIAGERIVALGEGLEGEHELDATGCYVLPGAIDAHVHLRMDDQPDLLYDDGWESGTIAAAFGGVTTVGVHAHVRPGRPLGEGFADAAGSARGAALVDYVLHANPRTPEAVDGLPEVLADGARSVKVYMVYDGYALPDDAIFRAFEHAAAAGALAIVHAENLGVMTELRRQGRRPAPALMEGEAVHRALALAQLAGARLLVFHLSAAEAVRELGAAKVRGVAAYGEVCPQYLALDESREDVAIGPPLRTQAHRDALWRGLADGIIDIASTDHGPRDRGGNAGLELRLSLLHELGVRAGRISLARWVDACSTRPAAILGLTGKGRILPGHDADLVVFDPDRDFVVSGERLHSDVDTSFYDGLRLHGVPVATIGRGELLTREGELMASPGRGRML